MVRSFLFPVSLFLAGCLCAGTAMADGEASSPGGIAYKRFRLPNGLTVVVHEDHSEASVSIGVRYHVGSADESEGKTGLAHLFEHLMFSGSQHHQGPYSPALLEIGATHMNARTDQDNTHFFETVPTSALDRALWLESDRMGYLLGGLTQDDLDTERRIVRNEAREAHGNLRSNIDAQLIRHLYPANHAYRHEVLGTPADVDALSLDDARGWFRDHYGAANATLVLAGDITPDEAREKAMLYFGEVEPGPAVARMRPWAPPLDASTRSVWRHPGQGARIVRAWLVPSVGHADLPALEVVGALLARGDDSFLHRRLVADAAVAVSTGVELVRRALSSELRVTVEVRDGVPVSQAEAALDEAMLAFLGQPVSADDMALIRGDDDRRFHESLESMSRRNAELGDGQVMQDDPVASWVFREQAGASDPARASRVAASWLGRPHHTLVVLPTGENPGAAVPDAGRPAHADVPSPKVYVTDGLGFSARGADRSRVPPIGEPGGTNVPAMQRGHLANGTEVVLLQRPGDPMARFRFIFEGGSAAVHERSPGIAGFTMALLDRGTQTWDAARFQRERRRTGASLDFGCDADVCFGDVSMPKAQTGDGLGLMADALMRPAFRPEEVVHQQALWRGLLGILHAGTEGVAERILPGLLYGAHPYAGAGDGTPASIAALGVEDVRRFHREFVRPDNLRIVVVADLSMGETLQALERALVGWKVPDAPLAIAPLLAVESSAEKALYLIDQPGAEQSYVTLGVLVPGSTEPDAMARELASIALGTTLADGLRETRGWTYHVDSTIHNRRGPRPWIIGTHVEAERTADTVAYLMDRLVAQSFDLDAAAVEVQRKGMIAAFPALLATSRNLLKNAGEVVALARSDDYLQTLGAQVNAVSLPDISRVTADALAGRLVLLVVGDRKRIEAPLRELLAGPLGDTLGELRLLDPNGMPVASHAQGATAR